ncbi:FUSC family protein [Flavobacterium sp. NRK F10]|uniref:FUSC family protein n=1 Tax=Flavobacterium sp. NRK F10 TaxID=2954931 RepID=UPI002090681F|nr:FUSC family protein [Flavobacterium sp. NRK F10]MCO6175801.1 FUSC family protein [Flavobacterium sp. NRK F10]
MSDFLEIVKAEAKSLLTLKKTERLWHVPLLASLCVGLPLLVGYFTDRLDYGLLSCMAGLVILYLPTTSVARRMITLLSCSFGFMISFTIGVLFSFNPYISALVLGLFTVGVHWVVRYFDMKPPGSFFFVMIASIASCMPFDFDVVPLKVGLVGMGAMLACLLALFYSIFITKNRQFAKDELILLKKNSTAAIFESLIIGTFIGLSLLTGKLLELTNPYWLPISCMAVLQGVSLQHVWSRSFQRILGTFIGLGLAWGLVSLHFDALGICLTIMILQFIIEMLVVRHYGLAVIFITPLTIFLAEAGGTALNHANDLIETRFFDILIGSLIGAIAGYFLYHEKLRRTTERQIRKTKVSFWLKKRN